MKRPDTFRIVAAIALNLCLVGLVAATFVSALPPLVA